MLCLLQLVERASFCNMSRIVKEYSVWRKCFSWLNEVALYQQQHDLCQVCRLSTMRLLKVITFMHSRGCGSTLVNAIWKRKRLIKLSRIFVHRLDWTKRYSCFIWCCLFLSLPKMGHRVSQCGYFYMLFIQTEDFLLNWLGLGFNPSNDHKKKFYLHRIFSTAVTRSITTQ